MIIVLILIEVDYSFHGISRVDDLVSSQSVAHYDFDIVSPVFQGIATNYRWYLTKV